MKNIQLRIIENDLSSYKIVTGFESFEFTRAWNSQGRFRIEINTNTPTAQYLEVDKIVYLDKYPTVDKDGNLQSTTTEMYGYIKKITIDRKTDKSQETLTVEGVELKDHIPRLIYPDSGDEFDSYTNEYLETVVKSLIQRNASGTSVISGAGTAATARQIPNVKVKADTNRGTQIDYSARYKYVPTELYSLLKSQQMGLKADLNYTAGTIEFDVAVGNDYTATIGSSGGIVLDIPNKTVLRLTDTDDRLNYKNLSVTAGLGSGADQTIEEVYSGTEPTGWDREEVFTSAPDVDSDDELETRGSQKLSELSRTRSISCQANELGSYRVGDQFDLGDYVSIDVTKPTNTTQTLYDAQIVKLKYTFEKTRILQIDITFDYDVDDSLMSAIQAKHQDYDSAARKTVGNVVYKNALTAAASSESVTVDINNDGGMYEFWLSGAASALTNVELFINTDTTSTNYYAMYEKIDPTYASNRENTPRIGAFGTVQSTIHGYVWLNPVSGQAIIEATTTYRSGTNLSGRRSTITSVNTFTNITTLTFDVGANTFDTDTTFVIYKR